MMHKIRETQNNEVHGLFCGQVEVGETYFKVKEKNKHNSKKLNIGRGTVGDSPIIGVNEQTKIKVAASPTAITDVNFVNRYVRNNLKLGATLYTDSGFANEGVYEKRETVNNSVDEYAKQKVHRNCLEAFWALCKLGKYHICHRIPEKHLVHYVNEFVGDHYSRSKDYIKHMQSITCGIVSNQLVYRELVK